MQQAEEQSKEKKRKRRRWLTIFTTVLLAIYNWPIALIGVVLMQMKSKIGTMSFDQLNNVINVFESQHLIKRNEEGIRNIKKSLFDN